MWHPEKYDILHLIMEVEIEERQEGEELHG